MKPKGHAIEIGGGNSSGPLSSTRPHSIEEPVTQGENEQNVTLETACNRLHNKLECLAKLNTRNSTDIYHIRAHNTMHTPDINADGH